jgi:hypothetical protein
LRALVLSECEKAFSGTMALDRYWFLD